MIYFTPNPEDYQIFDPIPLNWVFTIVIFQIIYFIYNNNILSC